jgi:hypothetical protein
VVGGKVELCWTGYGRVHWEICNECTVSEEKTTSRMGNVMV